MNAAGSLYTLKENQFNDCSLNDQKLPNLIVIDLGKLW